MDYLEDEEFKKRIKNKTCRGCSNRCSLLDPCCYRSHIYIEEEYDKYLKEDEQKSF